MRSAILATVLLLAATLTNADSPSMAPAPKAQAATRNLHFDWDDVKGASYYRLMYSVGSGAYRPAIDKVPAATSRATVSVPLRLASRPSLRYVVAACDTVGCAKSSGISPHKAPISKSAWMCDRPEGSLVETVDLVCMERVSARFYRHRRL
jgi:hypothetical protein